MARPKGTKNKIEEDSNYLAVLEMSGTNYEGKGETIFDALGNIPLDFTQVKTKGTITVTKGEKKAEKLFYLKPLRMLFANHLRRAGWAKQLQSILENS